MNWGRHPKRNPYDGRCGTRRFASPRRPRRFQRLIEPAAVRSAAVADTTAPYQQMIEHNGTTLLEVVQDK